MNKVTLHIMALLYIAFAISSASAQVDFQGRIVSQATNMPIEGVEIYNHQSGKTELSDNEGGVRFSKLSTGVNIFTLFGLEYQTSTDTLSLPLDGLHTFRLQSLNFDLSTIDIVSSRKEIFAIKQMKDIDGTSIFAGKKSEVIIMDMIKGNLASNNSRQVYAHIAGLNIYEGNDGGLQLNLGGRGLDPNRTSNFNTRQDGYDISADVLGYPENYYTPPAEAISEIRIIRGASSLQYGTQFGGLIDFRIRKIPSYKKVEIVSNQTLASFGALSSYNSIGANLGKLSFNTFYNYKKGDGYRPNSEYTSKNAFLSASYDWNENTSVGAEITYFNYLAKQAGGLTDQQFEENPRQSTRERNWFDVDWKLYNVNFSHRWNQNSMLSVSLFGLDASRKSVGYRGNPINLNENPITSIDEKDSQGKYILPRDLILGTFSNYGGEVKWLSNYKIKSKKSVLLLGSKYYRSNNTSVQGPGSASDEADFGLYTNRFLDYPSQSSFRFPNVNVSFFAENIFYLSDQLSITPGLRIEYIKTESEGTYNQVSFDNAGNAISNNTLSDDKNLKRNFMLLGLGLSYNKNEHLHLVANISQNYRSVTFSDIRVVSPTFMVDPNIKDEKGLTADIGLRGRVNKLLSYEFTVYSVLYNDRIGIILDDRANRVRKNIGKAIIAGTESLINFNISRYFYPTSRHFNANVFLNTAFTASQYLASEENNVVGKKVEFIPKINIKSGLSCKYKNVEAAYNFSLVSQQFTDVQNSGKASLGDQRSGVVGPIPSYSISDLTVSYSLSNFTLKSGVNNLFDRSYYTRRATGYPGPGIIPSDGRSFFVTISFKN